MTHKPRIKRDYSLTLRRMCWFCRGSGVMGYGNTPLDAYRDWLAHMRLRGLMSYPTTLEI